MLHPEGELKDLGPGLGGDPNGLCDRWLRWKAGIQYEIDFWNRWCSCKGSPWTEDFDRRTDQNSLVDQHLEGLLKRLHKPRINILDVGAGPLTCLGKNSPSCDLTLVATDPLALYYDWILSQHSISAPIRTEFALGEDLTLSYQPNSFDIVHSRNAIDHSLEPVRAIIQMLNVCRIGGYVILRHAHNEAETEKYSGFHNWNFTIEDHKFIIWNRSTKIDVSALVCDFAESEIILSDGYLINTFKKIAEVPTEAFAEDAKRLFLFFRLLVSTLVESPRAPATSI